jgi:prepilin-type N-terminal cleavage/methylation domain-containing protein
MFNFYKRKRFTLIELIVVIAIIGILTSIVVPNIRDTQGKATVAALVSDRRNLQTGVDMYQLENYGEYPVIGDIQPEKGGTYFSFSF